MQQNIEVLFFKLKVLFNQFKLNIKIYEMFCKIEWEKSCLNLMIFLNLQFLKEEEEFRFILSEEKLFLLVRFVLLEKEKLERERRKDKFQFNE